MPCPARLKEDGGLPFFATLRVPPDGDACGRPRAGDAKQAAFRRFAWQSNAFAFRHSVRGERYDERLRRSTHDLIADGDACARRRTGDLHEGAPFARNRELVSGERLANRVRGEKRLLDARRISLEGPCRDARAAALTGNGSEAGGRAPSRAEGRRADFARHAPHRRDRHRSRGEDDRKAERAQQRHDGTSREPHRSESSHNDLKREAGGRVAVGW